MESAQSRLWMVQTPQDLPTPQPHLPLRRASVEKLQSKRPTPVPVWTPSYHQVRGFNPSPVRPLQNMDNVTASSEHAFAGKSENGKRPFKPPLGVLGIRNEQESRTQEKSDQNSSPLQGNVSRPPSSPLGTPPLSPHKSKTGKLRTTRSVGEGLRKLGSHFSSPKGTKVKRPFAEETRSSAPVHAELPAILPFSEELRSSAPIRPLLARFDTDDEIFRPPAPGDRSAVTSNSSFFFNSSIHTGHSSSLTAPSSHTSELLQLHPEWTHTNTEIDTDEDMTVEDAIGMYADGFDNSARPSVDTEKWRATVEQKSLNDKRSSFHEARPSSQHSDQERKSKRINPAHRRSQSASLLLNVPRLQSVDGLEPPRRLDRAHTFSRILSAPVEHHNAASNRASFHTTEVPRDRHGFKKASLYVTVEQYDAWNEGYSAHLERRRKKWDALMKSYGLYTERPIRFPPKGDKIKRYVRKGIPPEFRGAAWFWYAGGPGKLAKQPGLYKDMLERVKGGGLSDNDREHIERDLNRTFPDNIRFKPDPTTMMDAQAGAGGGGDHNSKRSRNSAEPETPMLQALRRVLQAFAVHNPQIGYCQSLNFIAGLLLLFLDQDEEKAFVLLNVVTTTHLPGTHGVALEGANIDIAVLMSCVRDSLPAIWARLDDNGGAQLASSTTPYTASLRLPTVSLATTAWFMSLFVGTLPIECVLRIWDCLFFEGSKTLFRIALAILKFGERDILAVSDPIEIFQVVQTIPRTMLDINSLMEVCFRRRGGFGHVSQGLIESRREERRIAVREGVAVVREAKAGGNLWRGRWRAKTRV